MPANLNLFTILFADDTTFECKDNNLINLVTKCNSELAKANEWFLANRLTLNAKKTKCILFAPKGESPPLPLPVRINGVPIERIGKRFTTKAFKLVGVMIDDFINWEMQTKHVRNKLAKTNHALARLKRLLPEMVKLNVYNSLFKSHLEFCLPIWGDCCNAGQRGFLKLQKQAVRNISLAKYNSHTDPLFKKYSVLKFEDLHKFNLSTFVFNVGLGRHPDTINNIFSKSSNFDRNLNYYLENLKYTYLKKQVPHTLVKNWNSLHLADRNWLREKPTPQNKNLSAAPAKVMPGNNYNLNKFRLNNFKKSLKQQIVYNYKSDVKCRNKFCRDCR